MNSLRTTLLPPAPPLSRSRPTPMTESRSVSRDAIRFFSSLPSFLPLFLLFLLSFLTSFIFFLSFLTCIIFSFLRSCFSAVDTYFYCSTLRSPLLDQYFFKRF